MSSGQVEQSEAEAALKAIEVSHQPHVIGIALCIHRWRAEEQYWQPVEVASWEVRPVVEPWEQRLVGASWADVAYDEFELGILHRACLDVEKA